MLKKILLIFGIGIYTFITKAQTKDSIPDKVRAIIADKFPAIRVLNLEYEIVGGFKYASKYLKNPLPKGEVQNMHQANASMNVNLMKRKNWTLGTLVGYRHFSVELLQPDLSTRQIYQEKQDYHYHHESLNFTYYSRLFGKMAIYSASLMTDGSEKGFERVRGMLMGNLVLKATREVQMTLGVVGLLDPSALVPVIPTFTYKRQYQQGWVVDVVLPKAVYLRKTILGNGRASFGSELDNNTFYIYDFAGLWSVQIFNQMNLNSGLLYEHNLGRSFIAMVKTGMRNSLRSRISEKNKSQNDFIYEASTDPSFYFNAGLSFNPFAKKRVN